MARTVADMLVGTLEQIGVRHVFGLIGDSLNPLADAIRRSRIDWVGVRHEEGAALAAAGQAKLTGRLAVCAGTTGPGSTHLVAGLYEAARDHAPVLALSGDMPRKLRGIDYIQSTEPDLLFRDVSLYTETVSSPAQAARVVHQAIAAAYAGRGVAHLTLPQDVIAAGAEGSVPSVVTQRSSMRSSPPTRCRTCRTSTSPWLGASRWPRSGKRFSRLPLGDACRRRLRGIVRGSKSRPHLRQILRIARSASAAAHDSIRMLRLPGMPVDAIRTMTSLQTFARSSQCVELVKRRPFDMDHAWPSSALTRRQGA